MTIRFKLVGFVDALLKRNIQDKDKLGYFSNLKLSTWDAVSLSNLFQDLTLI